MIDKVMRDIEKENQKKPKISKQTEYPMGNGLVYDSTRNVVYHEETKEVRYEFSR